MSRPTSDLDYDLPSSSIAQEAIEPRDASRLLVTSSLTDHRFSALPDLLRPGDLLVVNRTRVRRARIATVRIDTGGRIEVLLLDGRNHPEWEVMVKPARRLRAGIRLASEPGPGGRRLTMDLLTDPDAGVARARIEGGDVEAVVAAIGSVPLPPYFHGELADDERYQTVFADQVGSAAAPTAALHFTSGLVRRVADHGVTFTAVDLEVGLDTFRPIAVDDVDDHRIHTERYTVPIEAAMAIADARERGGRVIAVGTTVVRTLETAAVGSTVRAGRGISDLFILPGYRCRVVDAVLTNFHAPRTSLVALVAALLGPRWRTVYETALERGYRFLSFGDAMFIDDIHPDARRPA
jgi:S-adenosylmethionine:tRNA ribosyltransferase-isomerase